MSFHLLCSKNFNYQLAVHTYFKEKHLFHSLTLVLPLCRNNNQDDLFMSAVYQVQYVVLKSRFFHMRTVYLSFNAAAPYTVHQKNGIL